MKKILLISLLCASLLLCACQREKHMNTFAAQTGICLQERGRTLFRYDPLTCQLAFNRDRRTFRVHTDNMSDFYSFPSKKERKSRDKCAGPRNGAL